jgi:hypothetical protein
MWYLFRMMFKAGYVGLTYLIAWPIVITNLFLFLYVWLMIFNGEICVK